MGQSNTGVSPRRPPVSVLCDTESQHLFSLKEELRLRKKICNNNVFNPKHDLLLNLVWVSKPKQTDSIQFN